MSAAALLERADALVPLLEAHAAQTERERCVAPAVMRAVFDAALLRYFVPRRYGGYELDWGTQLQLGRVLAHGCGSTSWLSCVVGSHSAYVARMSVRAQDEVWGPNPDVLIASGSVGRGVTITRERGGFRLNGRWSFCSGIDHAEWVMTRGVPQGEESAGQYYFLYPRAEAQIADDWFVSGLRGSGSKSVVAENLWVPEHRTLRLSALMSPDPPGGAVNAGYLYTSNFRPFAGSALLGPVLGAAETIVGAWIDALRGDRTALARDVDIEDTNVALAVAQSEVEIGTGRLLAESIVSRQLQYARQGLVIPRPARIALWRDRTFAAQLCFQAAERVVARLGARDILEDGPLQRHFRDLCAMLQQIGINWDRNMSNCGRATLGLSSDIPYFNGD